VSAIQSSISVLQQFSLPLLGVFALIAFYTQLGPLVMSGGSVAGEAVASVLLPALKAGVYYWLLTHLPDIATAAFTTFLQWGAAPAGGGFASTNLLQPSSVLDIGFRAAADLLLVTSRLGWSPQSWTVWLLFNLAYVVMVASFYAVSLHLALVIIEFYLSVLVGCVLIPWGILGPVAFLAEASIGWITGGLIRALVTVAILGIAVPLFDLAVFTTTPGGDPTVFSAMIVMLISLTFALLSWVIPSRAAAVAGRGRLVGTGRLHGRGRGGE
jgi:type IV secretory pathway TrbL component